MGCDRSPEAKEAKYLKKGKADLSKKDFARAILEFKNAATIRPHDAEAYYQLGLAYLASHLYSPAVTVLRRATELNPKDARARVKLAEILTASQQKPALEEASRQLQSVLNASPNNPEALDTLAIAEWRLGKTDDAEKRFESVLRGKNPAALNAAVNLARLKLSNHDPQGAEHVLTEFARKDPNSSQAELALGELYVLMKEPQKAEEHVRRTIQLDSRSGPALLTLATIEAAGHRNQEAEQTYRQLAALPQPEYRPLHALFLLQIGKRDAAVAELEKLAKDNPSDRTIRTKLVAVYVQTGRTVDAERVLAVALHRNPRDADALFQRGQLYLLSGKLSEAEQDIRQVLHLKPDSAPAHAALAATYQAKNLPNNQQQELWEALRLDPSLVEARVALAKSLVANRQAKSALSLLNGTPPAQKSLWPILIERNWALWWDGDTAQLKANLEQQLAIRRMPELVMQETLLKMKERDYARARAGAEEVLHQDPGNFMALHLLLDTYIAQHDLGHATIRLEQLVTEHPNSAPLQDQLGNWCLKVDRLPEARKAFEAAEATDPKYLPPEMGLANVDVRENKLDAAKQRLTAIAVADPNNIKVLMMLAGTNELLGNRAEAIATYRRVIAVDSVNVIALNNLAYELAPENPDEALKFAQQAGEDAPDNPMVADTLGWVYFKKGDYPTAINYLKAAVSKGPTPEREFHLAMTYLKVGDHEEAMRLMASALKQDPNLPKKEQGW